MEKISYDNLNEVIDQNTIFLLKNKFIRKIYLFLSKKLLRKILKITFFTEKKLINNIFKNNLFELGLKIT